jgi:hypothetical protein
VIAVLFPTFVGETEEKCEKSHIRCMSFDVLTAVKLSMLIFCIAAPCGLIYRRFGETCSHLQVWFSVTTQKTNICSREVILAGEFALISSGINLPRLTTLEIETLVETWQSVF